MKLFRRSIIITSYILLITILSHYKSSITRADEPAKQPKIVLIMADDLNDWLGCYNGHPNTLTPNIDAFAAKALMFTKASCVVPLCSSSRIAMLTGQAPWTTGIYSNNITSLRSVAKADDYITLPQMLKNNGYSTYTAGKIFHNPHPPDVDPISWTEFAQTGMGSSPPINKHSHGFHEEMPTDWFRSAFDFGPSIKSLEETGDYKSALWAANKVTNTNAPTFIAYGSFLPHLPWYVPQKFFDMHPLDGIQLPPILDSDLDDIFGIDVLPEFITKMDTSLRAHGKREEAVQGYLACISFADECIGKVLDSVSDSDIVIITSDHGWHLGEKRQWSKFKPWERSTRVPFLIRVPGVTPDGMKCNTPISLLDIYPTILELCGIETDYHLDGQSFVDVLSRPDIVQYRHVVTVSPDNTWYSVRSVDYRLIVRQNGPKELYDLANDPNEWTNLIDRPNYQAIVIEMEAHVPSLPAARL